MSSPFATRRDSVDFCHRYKNCSRNPHVRRQLISHILPPEQALCQLSCIWYWLNGSTFHRLRAEIIIIIKYLAEACSEVNFTCQFCLQSKLSIAYPVCKLHLTDDTRLTLILKLWLLIMVNNWIIVLTSHYQHNLVLKPHLLIKIQGSDE